MYYWSQMPFFGSPILTFILFYFFNLEVVGAVGKKPGPHRTEFGIQEVKGYWHYVDSSLPQKRLYDDSPRLLPKPQSSSRNEGYVSPRTAYTDIH